MSNHIQSNLQFRGFQILSPNLDWDIVDAFDPERLKFSVHLDGFTHHHIGHINRDRRQLVGYQKKI